MSRKPSNRSRGTGCTEQMPGKPFSNITVSAYEMSGRPKGQAFHLPRSIVF